ncbi:hypothetical protein BD414DRAFT_533206 [Trametes punicea]|nr:hypothetical protein BD414DRAFT_533206 [Trametes punicea]
MRPVAFSFELGTVKAFQIENLMQFFVKTHDIISSALALDAGTDFLLAGAIIAALFQNRASHARFPKIEVGVLYVLNTGLLSGVRQAIAAILSMRYLFHLYWAAFGLLAQRMHAITLLSVQSRVKVFNQETFARNILARADQLAAVEQWNVPRVLDDDTPRVINVKVAAEIAVNGRADYDASGFPDQKEMTAV